MVRSSTQSGMRKILEIPFLGGMLVPIAIVLLGGGIVFGVGHMLSTQRDHRSLVYEMQQKSFGNRWVAAWELAKLISSSRIPSKDIPWLVKNLKDIFDSSVDLRTKNFIVVALGALKRKESLPVIKKALELSDRDIKFNAVVALGKMPGGFSFDWTLVENFLAGEDRGLAQAAVLTLATHRVEQAQGKIKKLLGRDERNLRYAAAMGLINYRDGDALEVLREILLSTGKDQNFSEHELSRLKINIISLLVRESWPNLNDTLQNLTGNSHVKVAAKALWALNKLKRP